MAAPAASVSGGGGPDLNFKSEGAPTVGPTLDDGVTATLAQFDTLWRDNEVVGHGEGIKRLYCLDLGAIELEFSTFSVEGRPDLSMMVYMPANSKVAARVRAYIEAG